MNFRDLGLTAPILKALTQAGYTDPTPIQRKAIPPALAGRDVLGCAQTGTGKTCAFAAPILQRLSGPMPRPRVIRALILTPTRELAIQIQDSFTAYGRNLPLRSAVIFGGVGQQPQVDAIRRGLDILVATPGRLLDLHGQGLLDLSRIEIFVLDEADRMLDMGFIHDVKRILKLLPEQKQTLFFSATMPPEVMGLVNGLLHDYQRVEVDPVSSPVEAVRQSLYYVDKSNKTKLLAHLMEERHISSALVFSRTKHGANRIAQDLIKRGISAAAIHGNKSQTARVQALGDFKAGRVRVLCATDIAARGIDITDLPFVFNYNLPDVPETYVHRIGRTGRAGREGEAVSFCQFDEKDELRAIEKLLGRPIPVVEGHPFPMENFDPPQKDKRGRPVNSEDAEARAAAKERRRSRDAENKARAEQRRPAAAPAADVPPAPAGEDAPKKKKRRRKKSGADAALSPVPAQEAPLVLRSKPIGRGVRQGRIQDTLPDAPSVPDADFYKPSPLDSDVIMDATARLLAPRRPAPRPQAQGGRGQGAPKEQAAPPRPQQSKPRRQGKRQGAPAQPAREPVLPPSLAGKKRRRRDERPRPIEAPMRSDRQKDSTQHKSLMRPYYLHDGE
ncbi:MAG: DEAD/DEAH box helicase [Oscillospiraceae bacterium]|jgi:ATP-dependent RNA helicase RhlE|nr:DEAD/DEAH box helicase [Oscillospiraceae bacterium]MCI9551125.1 DEAD/DEAH box helicase [Oscillospiraceae bacterium]